MRQTSLCVLSLFFFIIVLSTLLCCGHTQDAELTFEPSSPSLFSGESVTFTCHIREGIATDWQYRLNRNGRQIASFSTSNVYSLNLKAQSGGVYQCVGRQGSTNLEKQSNNVTLSVSEHRPKATLTADGRSIPVGGAVTLQCSVGGSAGWTYEWLRRTSDSDKALAGTESLISISEEGLYQCRGRRGNPAFLTKHSDVLRLEMTLPNWVSVALQQRQTSIFSGEAIAVMCVVEGGGDAAWEYEWRTDSSNTPPAHSEYRIRSASVSHSGSYWCKGRRGLYSSTGWSAAFQLTVSPRKPTVVVYRRTDPGGGGETLTCSVEDSAEWKYTWFRRASVFSESEILTDGGPDAVISISIGGIYHCRAERGSPVFFTEDSHAVTVEKRVPNKAVVSLQPNWSLIFTGEAIAVRCEIDGGGDAEWEYEWSKPGSNAFPALSEYRIGSAAVSHSGNYRCMGKHKQDLYSSTAWSEATTLTVSSHRPKANLTAEDRAFPVGGSVTLTCSVNPSSSGWEYFWYRGKKTSEPLTAQDAVVLSTWQVSVSRGGLYWCRGGRGNPVYYTEYSDPVSVSMIITNQAVVTLQPNWPEIYSGETISLICEIQGGHAEWEYEWATTGLDKSTNQREYRISYASLSDSVQYWCKGRLERPQHSSTAWSASFTLKVDNHKPKPVLTVSPRWLSSGDSVTLNCGVAHPSAGWRFYWYKAVPNLSDNFFVYNDLLDWPPDSSENSYSYELLPSSSRGTEQDSHIVHGQTGTAGYACRAGRGDPVYYTDYSKATLVWSGDLHSQASLTVSPDRVQHFTSHDVSLHCEGNSTQWRVMRLNEGSYRSVCSHTATLTGFTCNISSGPSGEVYWCETGSGKFSNAVNITAADDIILVSPVHPVAEGQLVTLGCKSRTEQLLSNVIFYKNEKVIQSDDRAELSISAASKSDEGFYKCQYSGNVSSESWMAVKSSSSPSPVALIVGLVIGMLLIVLLPLLLLSWYKRSKDTFCHRLVPSQRTNQNSATIQTVDKDENEHQVYSLLQGNICVYETIGGSGNTGTGIYDDPAESCDYGNLNLDSTAGL